MYAATLSNPDRVKEHAGPGEAPLKGSHHIRWTILRDKMTPACIFHHSQLKPYLDTCGRGDEHFMVFDILSFSIMVRIQGVVPSRGEFVWMRRSYA